MRNGKAYWIGNADSYVCSACGYEVNNPNKQPCGPTKCSNCGAEMETKESNIGKQDKPRLAEVLGVEKGQKFRVDGFKSNRGEYIFFEITDDGFDYEPKGATEIGHAYALIDAINHPESIIRAPRLTEAELAICKAAGAKWVTRPISIGFGFDFKVFLWREKPQYLAGDNVEQSWVAAVSTEIFKSVHPGDCINVEATP